MKMYNRITIAGSFQQFNVLKDIYEALLIERDNMNAFFDSFLSNAKLTNTAKTSPAWITYDKKFAEYSELESNIKTAKFYLGDSE